MEVESLVYGAVMGIALVFVMWRMGVRMTPWPEALLAALLGIALWLALRLAGVDNALSITIGVLAGGALIGIWRHFIRRPA